MTVSRTLRFSRTIKTHVAGNGVTLALLMEVEGVWLTDPANAILDVVDKGGGRLTLQLNPQPEGARITTASATAVDFSNQATPTLCVDLTEAIEDQMSEEAIMEIAGEIITPDIAPPPRRRAALLAGVNDRPLQVF